MMLFQLRNDLNKKNLGGLGLYRRFYNTYYPVILGVSKNRGKNPKMDGL